MTTLFLATNDGVVVAEGDETDWQVAGRGLSGRPITSVIAREGVVLAGTEDGIFRSDDGGATWQGASDGLRLPHVRWLAYHPDVSDHEIAGTEPAGIFISHDGGGTWRECPEVISLRDNGGWYLPYSPAAGCIRGFALHADRAYAAAEVGGVLRSDDGGEAWQMAPGSTRPGDGTVHRDVHSVVVHPSSPDLVVAATGGGLFRSDDGGATWRNLYPCYCRAVWLDPADPDHIIFGPAGSVDRRGRIEDSHDGGASWRSMSQGTDAPWPQHMVERLAQIEDYLFAVLSNGQLLVTPLDVPAWEPLLPETGWVNATTAMA